jgi:hypothetical protein
MVSIQAEWSLSEMIHRLSLAGLGAGDEAPILPALPFSGIDDSCLRNLARIPRLRKTRLLYTCMLSGVEHLTLLIGEESLSPKLAAMPRGGYTIPALAWSQLLIRYRQVMGSIPIVGSRHNSFIHSGI